jgi:hydroxymethylglutaryl-CoA reductase (NADPH)
MTDGVPARGQYTEEARRLRLDWLRARTGTALPSLDVTGLDAGALTGNVENFTGSVEVPVGLAGPLLFTGDAARGSVVAPLATTEGALVASASRGARAITAGGGVTTKVLHQRMTRAPAFEFADIAAAQRFTGWLQAHRPELEEQVRLTSRYARLVDVDPYQLGRYLHVRFVFETADAAGQNMTTAATWRICRWVQDTLAGDDGLRPVWMLVDGNLSSDKKLSVASMLAGRGTRVTAECRVPTDAVTSVLKTTPAEMVKGHATWAQGAQQAGITGSGVNVANIVAGLFVATGQDIACVHESAVSILSLEVDGGDLIATMLLPSLVSGSVGGGTSLPHQHEWLTALGCAGAGGSGRFAEIVAGFALALDLSTLAALVSGQFADAHERLGRSRRVDRQPASDVDAGVPADSSRPAGRRGDGRLGSRGEVETRCPRVVRHRHARQSSCLHRRPDGPG